MNNDESDLDLAQQSKKEPLHFPNSNRDSARRNTHQKRYQNMEPNNSQAPKGREKAVVVALSAITCLFMCVIGYEIIDGNYSKKEMSKEESLSKEQKKNLTASKKSLISSDYAFTSAFSDADDDYEDPNVRVLREQNKQQSIKIKQLRHELLEKIQNIHEIKANLFKQDGDPRDKETITDLSQKLLQKEHQNSQLTQQITNVESSTAELKKKISHLESMREALMDMMETQHNAKEHEIAALKKQVDDQQNISAEQINEVTKKSRIIESTHQHLAESLEKKTAALNHLEEELANHKQLLSIKNGELKQLQNQYGSSEEEIKSQILELVANIQFEATAKAITEKNLLSKIEEKSYAMDVLHAQIKIQKNVIEAQALNLRNRDHLTNEQMINLIASLEWETAYSHELKNKLNEAVEKYRLAVKESDDIHNIKSDLSAIQKINAELTAQLEVKEFLMGAERLQLKSLVESNQDTKRSALEHANTLIYALEVERYHNEKMKHDVETTAVNYANAQEYTYFLSDQLQEYAKKAHALETDLAVLLLKYSEKENEHRIAEELLDYTTPQIPRLIAENESLHHQIEANEKQIALNQQLEIDHQKQQIAYETYQKELQNYKDLESQLNHALAELEQHRDANEHLENQLQSAQLKSLTLKDEIKNYRSDLTQKQSTIDKLQGIQISLHSDFDSLLTNIKRELDYEKEHKQQISSDQVALLQLLKEVENDLEASLQANDSIQDELRAIAYELRNEKQRANQFEEAISDINFQEHLNQIGVR